MTTAAAQQQTQSRKPQIPGAAIKFGRDFPSSETFKAYPDLPVLEFDAYDLPEDFNAGCADVSFGSGGIPVSGGMLGTLRFQIADHQSFILVNPADAQFKKCLSAWRAARKVGIAWGVGDNMACMVLDIDADFGRQFDMAALTNRMSMAAFVRIAFGFIGTGLLVAQATSDLDTHPVLGSATAYLAVTKAVNKEGNAAVAEMESMAMLGRMRSPSPMYH